MKPEGKAQELFAAFSRVAARAFTNQRLVSCQVLGKSPYLFDPLRHYCLGRPHSRCSFWKAVRLTLACYAVNAAHLAALVLARCALFLSGWRAAELSGERFVLADTFLLCRHVLSEKGFSERYLPGLLEEARRNGCATAYFFRLHGTRNPLALYRVFTLLRRQAVPGCTDLHLFGATDWLRLVRHWLCYPLAHWRLVRSLRHAPPGSPEAYVREALVICLPQCHMIGEARRLAARRLVRRLSDGAHIVSWYENLTENKAFHLGIHQERRATGKAVQVIGAQLSPWCSNHLNNHADDAELPLHLAPDRVVVSGPFFLPEASRQVYMAGPSLRSAGLFSRPLPAPAADAPLLVLLSFHREEVERVLGLVQEAGLAERAVYKFHPNSRIAEYRALLPHEPRVVEGSLYDALQGISLVVGSGSGALPEAVAAGLPVVMVRNARGLSCLELNYLPEQGRGILWEGVRDAVELAVAAERLRRSLGAPERAAALAAFRDLLFTAPHPERIRRCFFPDRRS